MMARVIVEPYSRPPRRASAWSRLLRVVLGLVVLVILVCAGIAGYIDWRLTHPARTFPDFTPASAGLAYSEVSFPSSQGGITLSGWFMPAGDSTRTIILAHGYTEHRLGEIVSLPIARILVQNGYNVLAFDFRGEGHSGGDLVSIGEYEPYDVRGAIQYIQQRFAGQQPHIGLLGFSMGAIACLRAAAADPSGIDAILSDSAIADLYQYLLDKAQVWTHLPAFPFNQLILWEAPLVVGLDAHTVRAIDAVRSLTHTPVLFVAGLADSTVPYSNSVDLYHAAADPRDRLWLVPGADHTKAFDVAPAAYTARMLDFFGRYLQ
jgi:fermentation-respiration switch protein FrsA (DUF1100 family)